MSPSTPPTDIPPTMRAWISTARGPPSKVMTLSSVPTPPTPLAPTYVLVKISHAALNPGEVTIMKLFPRFARGLPSIIALDFTGTIIAVGTSVRSELTVGVSVFGNVPKKLILAGVGSLAEYIALPADSVMVQPENVSREAAAGLSACGVTAMEYMNWSGLRAGETVFVNGGTGGIGVMVVQMAKIIVGPSGKVIATCSPANADLVKSLGADEVLDYHTLGPLHKYMAKTYSADPLDSLFDNVGDQDLYNHSPAYLKDGKPYMSIGAQRGDEGIRDVFRLVWQMAQNHLWPRVLGGTAREFRLQATNGSVASYEQLRKLAEEGKVRGVVDSVWEIGDVLKVCFSIVGSRPLSDGICGIGV